jgi:hypothetical protein
MRCLEKRKSFSPFMITFSAHPVPNLSVQIENACMPMMVSVSCNTCVLIAA